VKEIDIRNGDCLAVLPTLSAESVDAVITDPPYGISYQSNSRVKTPKLKRIANDDQPFIWWLYDAYRVTKEGGALLCFCRWDVQETFRLAIELAGYTVKSQVIWDKGGTGCGDLHAQFSPRHEVIWFAVKGKFAFPDHRPASVLTVSKVPPTTLLHPNQKPIELMEQLVEFVTTPGDLVLDPFTGSGSTGVACAKSARQFIGIEMSAEYCAVAERRIAELAAQPALSLAGVS
jgi:DNA modification methylase